LLPEKGNAVDPDFHRYLTLSSIPWTSTVPFRTLDDDVAMTSVFCYMITEYILIPKPIQMQPVLSQHLV
jgi:hypothetical protein